MAADTDRDAAARADGPAPADGRPDLLRAAAATVWRLVVTTVGTCMRYRVTGLAAEAAFFALLSLPPLIFGLTGSIGYVVSTFTDQRIGEFRADVVDLARQAFTEDIVDTIIVPTMNDVLSGPRYDVISIGFVLALWSGSRALNVFVDTVTIMYGLGGHRGIVKTRMLSFSLYVLGLVTGIVAIPLVVAGPGLVDKALPERLDGLNSLYWPTVVLICVVFTATLYHVSVPVRTSWRYNLPGAVLTLFVWIIGSAVLRWFLTASAGESTSIYGPLATPIAVMIWLYILAIAVLIGAALNAAFDEVWPETGVAVARIELMRRLRRGARRARRRHPPATGQEDETDVPDEDEELDDPIDDGFDQEETVVLRREGIG
jgi:membrane protein